MSELKPYFETPEERDARYARAHSDPCRKCGAVPTHFGRSILAGFPICEKCDMERHRNG